MLLQLLTDLKNFGNRNQVEQHLAGLWHSHATDKMSYKLLVIYQAIQWVKAHHMPLTIGTFDCNRVRLTEKFANSCLRSVKSCIQLQQLLAFCLSCACQSHQVLGDVTPRSLAKLCILFNATICYLNSAFACREHGFELQGLFHLCVIFCRLLQQQATAMK